MHLTQIIAVISTSFAIPVTSQITVNPTTSPVSVPTSSNEKDDAICAAKNQNGCESCVTTMKGNGEFCLWFGELDDPICAAEAKDGMGRGDDICAFVNPTLLPTTTISPTTTTLLTTAPTDSKDDEKCASKSSEGCESCTGTGISNGEFCLWFGEMENPVCAAEAKDGMVGQGDNVCAFVNPTTEPTPLPTITPTITPTTDPTMELTMEPTLTSDDEELCGEKSSEGCESCVTTAIDKKKFCLWFSEIVPPVCAAKGKKDMGRGDDVCAFVSPTMSPTTDSKDDKVCATKTSEGCEGCVTTLLGNGDYCLWFGDMENPVCAVDGKNGMGDGDDVCALLSTTPTMSQTSVPTRSIDDQSSVPTKPTMNKKEKKSKKKKDKKAKKSKKKEDKKAKKSKKKKDSEAKKAKKSKQVR
eukprot:CAMPEP_0194414848 /NCGR_PEP_ID=MMETSP0176-20130528/13612_1 /TAXON_ID=216777 /ORGANISM="Proboscia alata, Strain PI-D3" /LENGTH=412 /DNA_ID=CAMNT_0039219173 /DNA_START=1 /DNA_END=1239 /DNA_ORIENTATION=+